MTDTIEVMDLQWDHDRILNLINMYAEVLGVYSNLKRNVVPDLEKQLTELEATIDKLTAVIRDFSPRAK